MDLDDITGALSFTEHFFPAQSKRVADYSGRNKDVAVGLASAGAAVAAGVLAPLAATELLGVAAVGTTKAVIAGISSATAAQFMNYWLKDNVVNGGASQGGKAKYKDAYADLAASFVMRKVGETPKSAAVVFDAPYEPKEAITFDDPGSHFNMAGAIPVKVGELIELEASCSSRAYITTHVLDGSNAAAVFAMDDVSTWLQSFRIE